MGSVKVNIDKRMTQYKHPGAWFPGVNLHQEIALAKGIEQLPWFFASGRISTRLSLGSSGAELLGLMRSKVDAGVSLKNGILPQDPEFLAFAERNGLKIYSFPVETGEDVSPEKFAEMDVVVGTDGQVKLNGQGSSPERSVFVSANGFEILQINHALEHAQAYTLNFSFKGQTVYFPVTERTQKLLVDMVFQPSEEYMAAILQPAIMPFHMLLNSVLSRFYSGSQNGKTYLDMIMRSMILYHLDPYTPDVPGSPVYDQVNRMGRRLMAITNDMPTLENMCNALIKEEADKFNLTDPLLRGIFTDPAIKIAMTNAEPVRRMALFQIFGRLNPSMPEFFGIDPRGGNDNGFHSVI